MAQVTLDTNYKFSMNVFFSVATGGVSPRGHGRYGIFIYSYCMYMCSNIDNGL